jgi:transcription termination factor NusB
MPAQDNRHQSRLERVQHLFAWDFQRQNHDDEQFAPIAELLPRLDKIDEVILKFATKRTLEQFDKVDLAILRQALYELMYTNTPPAVAIDEAIEIAKSLADPASAGFIHGVLASYTDQEGTAHEPGTNDQPDH